jgi:hypothetical protein
LPKVAYYYALDVDKCSQEDTRNAACGDPRWAFEYAKNIDKCPLEDTWQAVKGTEYEKTYNQFFNQEIKNKVV